VNNRDKNFTRAKMERRLAQIEESVGRYLSQLDTADLQKASEVLAVKTDAPRRAHFSGLLSERVPRSDGWIGVMPMLCNALG
jgi:hypothetical protein